MKITACPRCGSMFIKTGSIGDGVLYGITSKYVCKQCGYQGMPLEFESENSYELYLRELNNIEEKEKNSDKRQDIQEKNISYSEDSDENTYQRGYIKEIIIAVIIAIFLSGVTSYYSRLPIFNIYVSTTGFIGFFLGYTIGIFLIIVFFETIFGTLKKIVLK